MKTRLGQRRAVTATRLSNLRQYNLPANVKGRRKVGSAPTSRRSMSPWSKRKAEDDMDEDYTETSAQPARTPKKPRTAEKYCMSHQKVFRMQRAAHMTTDQTLTCLQHIRASFGGRSAVESQFKEKSIRLNSLLTDYFTSVATTVEGIEGDVWGCFASDSRDSCGSWSCSMDDPSRASSWELTADRAFWR